MDPSHPALHPCPSVPPLLWFSSDLEASRVLEPHQCPFPFLLPEKAWESQQKREICRGDLKRDPSRLLGNVRQGLGSEVRVARGFSEAHIYCLPGVGPVEAVPVSRTMTGRM